VLVEIIIFRICNYRKAALGVFGVAFVFVRFCYDDYFGIRKLFRNLNGVGKSRNPGTDY
jgi:hypothetical protein